MTLVDVSIRRPVTVFISAVAAVVFGIVAFGQLATDLLPDITYPSLTVRTTDEGAAPVEVESLVTRPIENAVGVVQNLVKITSSSRPEISEVTLEFAWDTAMDFAALDVRERLDLLRLPLETEPPVLLRYDPSLDPILRIGVTGGDDLVRLRRVAEERIQRPLERIEGVAAAVVEGGLEEELQVLVDERRLANLGLGVGTVISRLAQENVNLTGGRLRDGQTEYLVRTVGELLRPQQLRELVIDAARGHPFVILFSVPLSVIGVLVTLYLFDVRISIVVLIGVVLLAGIVVNNAIILVDTANRLRREGMAKLDALRRAGRTRLRPILMTTATTVLGLTPMAIGLGEGSELRAPMALAVIGGLLSSTALTLVVIPVVYRLLDRGR